MIAILRTPSTSEPMSPGGRVCVAPPQQQRHHEIVGNGDRERDALDHHHAGRRRQPAQHGQQSHSIRARAERQGKHGQIPIDAAVWENR